MVGELVKKPEHEPRAYSVMPFVWSIGTIIGPVIGGTFAAPADSFPAVFSPQGLFGRWPWLLPNLVCATFMLGSMTVGWFWLEETHPDLKTGADPTVLHDIAEQTPMIAGAGTTTDPGVDLRQESYGTFNEVYLAEDKQWHLNADGSTGKLSSPEQPSCKVFT